MEGAIKENGEGNREEGWIWRALSATGFHSKSNKQWDRKTTINSDEDEFQLTAAGSWAGDRAWYLTDSSIGCENGFWASAKIVSDRKRGEYFWCD